MRSISVILQLNVIIKVVTKMEEREKFFNKINKVHKFVLDKVDSYMVVGSGALYACGIPIDRVPHDIDLEVICSDAQWKIFEALAESEGNDFHKNKGKIAHCRTFFENKPCIFNIKVKGSDEKILVNVWRVKKFNHSYLSNHSVKLATVESVLKIKMLYGRKKDWRYLTYIIKNLTMLVEQSDKESDFEEY